MREPANPLSHDSGDAAWLANGSGEMILEIANRRGTDISGTHIGPRAAASVGFTCGLTALAARIGRHLELPVVAAIAIDIEGIQKDLGLEIIYRPGFGLPVAGYVARDPALHCSERTTVSLSPASQVHNTRRGMP